MKCCDCVKLDVCNQKEIFRKVETVSSGISIPDGNNASYKMNIVTSNFGIKVDVVCNKFVPKNTYYDDYDD